MRLIYVAGCYSADNAWEREANIRRAEEVCARLWKAGVAAVCVHTMARYFHGFVPEDKAIAIDNAILDRCDAILLAPGWIMSTGTQGEIARARGQRKPVFEPHMESRCIEWALGGAA